METIELLHQCLKKAQKMLDECIREQRPKVIQEGIAQASFTDTPLTYSHPVNTTYYYFNDDAVITPSEIPVYHTGDTCHYLKGSLKDLPVLGQFGGEYYMGGKMQRLRYSGDTLQQGFKKSFVSLVYLDKDKGWPMYAETMRGYRVSHCFTLGYKQPAPWGGEDCCMIYYTDIQGKPLSKSIFIHKATFL